MDSLPQTSTAQQFCLRWHNHQASLLSSLPLLLDQSHLTDVTLSADGKTVRAHRVVLSACSTFFSELFRTLEPPLHPVIVLPGASFPSLIALLTFMYSGEVNVFEEQINNLLSLAETLGIKGLADFNGNVAKSPKNNNESSSTAPSTPTSISSASAVPITGLPTQSQKENENKHNLQHHHFHQQQQQQQQQQQHPSPHPTIPSPILDNFFTRPFNFYPHLIPQPINFSAVSPTSPSSSTSSTCNRTPTIVPNFFARFPLPQNNHPLNKPNTNSGNKNNICSNNNNNDNRLIKNEEYNSSINEDNNITSCTNKKPILNKNNKKIDKIAENLRCATSNKNYMENLKQSIIIPHSPPASMLLKPVTQPFPAPHHFLAAAAAAAATGNVDDCMNMRKTPDNFSSFDAAAQLQLIGGTGASLLTNHSMNNNNYNNNNNPNENIIEQSLDKVVNCSSSGIPTNTVSTLSTGGGVGNIASTKTPNSKLYATCFICNKQLSNQYNLRVHLETHQNVRYACTVCSHVSRSKDALRKHVSYRHPGTPSPCESETRRKRVKTTNNNNNNNNNNSSNNSNSNNNNNNSNISLIKHEQGLRSEYVSPNNNETVPNNNNNNNSNDPCKATGNYLLNQQQQQQHNQIEQTLSSQTSNSQSSILSNVIASTISHNTKTAVTSTSTTSATTISSNLPPNSNPPIKLEINAINEKIIDSSAIV